MPKKLILASQSEGRKKLLQEAVFKFMVIVSHFDEESIRDPDPRKLVQKLSIAKARAVLKNAPSNAIILAGDQVVKIGDNIVGKPKNEKELRQWLGALEHSFADIFQGYAIIDAETGKEWIGIETARVYFGAISEPEINEWIMSNKPFARAGGFSLREKPSRRWIARYDGEQSTIIGMPMPVVAPILNRLLGKV